MSAIKCNSCGFGSSKKMHKKRKGSPKKKCVSFGLKKRKGLKKHRKSPKKHSFGKINSALHIMGNTPANDMSIFQNYTGQPPMQMGQHLTKVPTNLRANFYANIKA